MCIQFVPLQNRAQVIKECPWAEYIKRVAGGFMCFESMADYETWRRQH